MALIITGRVFHQAGSWGSNRPLRNTGEIEIHLQNGNQSIPFGTGKTDQEGNFFVTGNLPALRITQIFIFVIDRCKNIMHHEIIHRAPNLIFTDNIGDITVPWEPEDAELAHVNSTYFKDTQLLAKKLCSLLISTHYPISIALMRESVDGSGKDYTPAQSLLIPLKVDQPGFLKHLVEDIQDEIVSVRADTINELAAGILERFSKADIKVLEDGRLVNRLLAAIQRAYPIRHAYSESLMKDPAHDMAAACVILFLAALMKKDKVQPSITFRSSGYQCAGGQGRRTFSRISIFVSKS